MGPKRRKRPDWAAARTCAGELELGRGEPSEQPIPNGPKWCVIKVERLEPQARRQRFKQLHIGLVISTLLLITSSPSTSSAALVAEDESSVVISSRQGQLFRGLKLPGDAAQPTDGVVAFLGLRYASAPVKRLRFMPPTPFNYAPTKRGTAGGGIKSNQSDQLKSQAHDMRHFGPICMQRFPTEPTREQAAQVHLNSPQAQADNLRLRRTQLGLMGRLLAPALSRSWRPLVRKLSSRFVQSEDCLNLNIYTPIEALRSAPATNRRQESGANASQQQSGELESAELLRPVLVLIHGQSFEFGAGSALDGRRFARDNRQVVITLNYRLHILGFPPRLGAGSRANLGLLDQVAALHWIQTNVRSFGGSPTKITLLGAKGGAIFVHLLMLSPLARGLFQRAVLEDGTALSPVIANNMAMAAASSVGPAATRPQLVNQHARLLAQLNDCPAPTGANSSQTTTSQDQELGLIIECLKSKPAELIMRHLPIELIDTSRLALASSSSIPLAPKWIRPLEHALELLVKEELQMRLDREEKGEATNETMLIASGERRHQMEELKRTFAAASNEPVSMDLRQLNWLVALMIGRFLQSPSTSQTTSNSSSGTTTSEAEDQTKLMALLTEILGAIYLPSNKTLPVGPLYAPQLEPGLILAETGHGQEHHQLNLASSMLQRNSLFARRDLMIGLTHSLIDFADADDEPGGLGGTQWQDEAGPHLAPGLFSRRLLDLGLTEAEAIGQVNLFVQSFYRFHQQEISNSIISHYLSRKSGSSSRAAIGDGIQATLSKQQQQQRPMSLERLQKQQFLAMAMRELYQHSLIDIPLIRTALIHSLQQLETAADLFVSHQVVKLEETQRDSNHDQEELEQLIDERHLEEEFFNFAKELYQNQARWPIRLLPATSPIGQLGQSTPATMIPTRRVAGQVESSIRSTFLFQIGTKFSWVRQRLQTALERLSSQHSTGPANELTAVKRVLVRFMEEISSKKFQLDTAGNWFGCSFVDAFEDNDEPIEGAHQVEMEDVDQNHSLWDRFRVWVCRRRLERRLANFVETGNVERGRDGGNLQEPSRADSDLVHECSPSLQELDKSNPEQDHHHLVQLYPTDLSPKSNDSFEIVIERRKETSWFSCRRRLEQVAFEELLLEQEQSIERTSDWNVFNVFTQQLANLFSGTTNEPNWSQVSFISSSSPSSATSQLKREQFEGKIAFWANFVSALNCSRTQPIGAGSLSLFSQANSTLLNMNLNLNCQQQQQQTANSAIQSIGQRIKHELDQQVAIWRRHRASKSRSGQLVANLSSNHHSLRMANMSNNHHHQDQQPQQQQQHQLEEGSQTELAEAVATPAGGGTNWLSNWLRLDNGPTADRKLPSRQLTPLVVVWSIGLSATLVSISLLAGFVLVLRRQRIRRKSQAAAEERTKETGSERELDKTSSLQLNVGQIIEQADQNLAAQSTDYIQQHENRDPSLRSPQYGNGHLLQYHPDETMDGHQVQADAVGANGTLELFTPADFVHHQHHHLVQYDRQAGNQTDLDRGRRNGNFTVARNQAVDLTQSDHQHHLPTCNLMLLHQYHQNQPLLSSSSETTSTTNNQRAQSSVSLVSTLAATPTNETDRLTAVGAVSSGSSVGTKKRVKISDPKQRPSWTNNEQLIHLPNGPVLHFGGQLEESHISQLSQFCPIHRSSSNLNLMSQSINDLELVNGTHSLMRHYNSDKHASQQQAHQHGHNFQQAGGSPAELCENHNFHYQ